ncbi:hypothetical protein BDV34DRAFT_204670 [Aspergillus parasiticus]|uniref:Uncharacterized protein n=1 Tax=Aspergillus parasiticus TaxID=5067 RepID=A0A5N6D857_ASPPA|nr:hypothetical protein BDV34DRAFT_204670 [Aspergillus parasiticus]
MTIVFEDPTTGTIYKEKKGDSKHSIDRVIPCFPFLLFSFLSFLDFDRLFVGLFSFFPFYLYLSPS